MVAVGQAATPGFGPSTRSLAGSAPRLDASPAGGFDPGLVVVMVAASVPAVLAMAVVSPVAASIPAVVASVPAVAASVPAVVAPLAAVVTALSSVVTALSSVVTALSSVVAALAALRFVGLGGGRGEDG